jgi:hypothetical protein
MPSVISTEVREVVQPSKTLVRYGLALLQFLMYLLPLLQAVDMQAALHAAKEDLRNWDFELAQVCITACLSFASES